VDYALNFAAVWRSFDKLLQGLGLSLLLAVGAIAIGVAIGLVLGFALVSRHAAARRLARCYVTVIRNTPILVLVLFVYFALPDLGLQLEGVESFVLVSRWRRGSGMRGAAVWGAHHASGGRAISRTARPPPWCVR